LLLGMPGRWGKRTRPPNRVSPRRRAPRTSCERPKRRICQKRRFTPVVGIALARERPIGPQHTAPSGRAVMQAQAVISGIEEHPAAALLERMRRGDRDAAAEFLVGYGPLIRRRIRGKLGAAMRRLFDSQEILSTVGRRLDAFVNAGRLEATTTPQLWGLVIRIAENALIEKARVVQSLKAREGEDSPFA